MLLREQFEAVLARGRAELKHFQHLDKKMVFIELNPVCLLQSDLSQLGQRRREQGEVMRKLCL